LGLVNWLIVVCTHYWDESSSIVPKVSVLLELNPSVRKYNINSLNFKPLQFFVPTTFISETLLSCTLINP